MEEEEDPVCRYCLGNDNEEKNPLVAPCRCKGSMRYVHTECLEMWRSLGREALDKCTMCQYRYEYPLFDVASSRIIRLIALMTFLYLIDATTLFFNTGRVANERVNQYLFYCYIFSVIVVWYPRILDYKGFRFNHPRFIRLSALAIVMVNLFIESPVMAHNIHGLVFLLEVGDSLLRWMIGHPRIVRRPI